MHDDLRVIKERILNEDKLYDIYEAMGCEYIKPSGNRIEAQLPERFMSPNKRAVQTKLNANLSSSIRNMPDFKGGDIFHLVSFIHHDKRGEEELKDDLFFAKKFICELLGWTEYLKGGTFKTKKDYLAPLKAILKTEKKRREIIPNPILPDDVMNQYYFYGKPLPYKEWIEEGISYEVQMLYGVGFDLESKRIVFPLKNRFGKIVGVKGRIMKDEDDDRKYLYLYPCNNRYEWFSFHLALPHIITEKRVYIVESEKSVMKLYSNGVYNAIAIGASDISVEQVDIIKSLGLDIEIVLCYDKGILIESIITQAEQFENRNVFAMFDSDNILEDEKSAPIDEGIEKWNELVNNYIFPIKERDK